MLWSAAFLLRSWMHWRHLSKQLHHLRSPREDLLYNKSSLVLLINSPDSMNRSHCTSFVACTYLHTSSTFDHILSKNTHCGFADNPLSISPMPIGLYPGFLWYESAANERLQRWYGFWSDILWAQCFCEKCNCLSTFTAGLTIFVWSQDSGPVVSIHAGGTCSTLCSGCSFLYCVTAYLVEN